MDLMKSYEAKGVIPEGQKVQRVIDRAWYVANEGEKGVSAKEANETFRNKNIKVDTPPLNIHAGLNLTKFETKIVSEGLNAPVLTGNKYPLISFGHGFTLNPNLYVSLYRHLASWGYIVIAPSTETGFSPGKIIFNQFLFHDSIYF